MATAMASPVSLTTRASHLRLTTITTKYGCVLCHWRYSEDCGRLPFTLKWQLKATLFGCLDVERSAQLAPQPTFSFQLIEIGGGVRPHDLSPSGSEAIKHSRTADEGPYGRYR